MLIDRVRSAVKHNANYNRIKFKDLGICDVRIIDSISDALKSEVDKIEFKMQISDQHLEQAITSHEFKNLFQTGYTNGCFRPEFRALLSCQLFNTPLEPTSLNNSEKYGFAFADIASPEYGDNIVVFDKTKLFHRTTATLGDSYNFSYTLPFLIDDIDASIGSVLINHRFVAQMFKNNKNAKTICDTIVKMMEELPSKIKSHSYAQFMELQFHGVLSTDCIKDIYKI